jgi:hypothetical protein
MQILNTCFSNGGLNLKKKCYNNNNIQAFYSQANWGRLEMKPHEPKNRDKARVKKKGRENKG